MLIKSALRINLSASYVMKSILVISRCAAPPYPAAPDFPPSGGQNKTPRNTLFINGSAVSTGYSATVEVLHRTSKWGEVRRLACPLRRFPFAAPPNCGGSPTQRARGNAFPRPQGGCMVFQRAKPGCMVFAAKGGIKKWRPKGRPPRQRSGAI